jgi:hypothetical protein
LVSVDFPTFGRPASATKPERVRTGSPAPERAPKGPATGTPLARSPEPERTLKVPNSARARVRSGFAAN